MKRHTLNRSITIVFTFLLLLMGCSGGKWSKMSSSELAAKRDECLARNPTSPGKVTACENVRKECERRRKNGDFSC